MIVLFAYLCSYLKSLLDVLAFKRFSVQYTVFDKVKRMEAHQLHFCSTTVTMPRVSVDGTPDPIWIRDGSSKNESYVFGNEFWRLNI